MTDDVDDVSSTKTTSLLSYDSLSSDLQRPVVIPFGDDYAIVASLTDVSKSASTSDSSVLRSTTVTQALGSGVKYRVVAYNSSGSEAAYKDYSYGNESTIGGFTGLTAGSTYTFVAYSGNSTSALPSINSENSSLTAATVSYSSIANTGSEQFMYFSKSLTLALGTNYLGITLANKFSQVKTVLSIDSTANGSAYFVSIGTPTFTPLASSASIPLNSGIPTFGSTEVTNGRTVVFPSVSSSSKLKKITSDSISLVHAATTSGALNIGAVTIRTVDGDATSDITRSVSVSGLSITPGHKYNLNLQITPPCVQVVGVSQDFSWSSSSWTTGTTHTNTVTMPAADYGFVFDIYTLDNSFNMSINGVAIATKEIQFQPDQTTNVTFADGTYWGDGTIAQVYNLSGNKAANKPIVRVVISAAGAVSLFASKYSYTSSNWALLPVVLKSGTSFNTVTWNSTSTNAVVVSQLVAGQTTMDGNGRGYKKITCTTSN